MLHVHSTKHFSNSIHGRVKLQNEKNRYSLHLQVSFPLYCLLFMSEITVWREVSLIMKRFPQDAFCVFAIRSLIFPFWVFLKRESHHWNQMIVTGWSTNTMTELNKSRGKLLHVSLPKCKCWESIVWGAEGGYRKQKMWLTTEGTWLKIHKLCLHCNQLISLLYFLPQRPLNLITATEPITVELSISF